MFHSLCGKKSQESVHKPQVLKRKESRSGSNQGNGSDEWSYIETPRVDSGPYRCPPRPAPLQPLALTLTVTNPDRNPNPKASGQLPGLGDNGPTLSNHTSFVGLGAEGGRV